MIPSFLRSLRGRHQPAPQPAAAADSLEWVRFSGGPLEGREMYVDLEVPTWKAMAEGDYEPFIFESLGEGGYESKTVWDVGAFMGYHALAFAALVGEQGRVVTFEPNPFNVERIRMNLERSPDLAPRVTVVTDALSNEDGQTAFTFSSSVDTGNSSGSHIAGAFAPEVSSVYESFEQITVNTVRADTLLREGRVPVPSLIKMDVEGAEAMVLEGAVEMLSTARPTLLLEVHHIVTMLHTQQLLSGLGYELKVVHIEKDSASRCHVLAKPKGR